MTMNTVSENKRKVGMKMPLGGIKPQSVTGNERSAVAASRDVLKGVPFNKELAMSILSNPKYAEVMRKYVAKNNKEIAALAEAGPMQKTAADRKKRTYDRLKSKGMCTDDIRTILSVLIGKQNLLALASSYMHSGEVVEIPVDDWYDAFNLIVIRHEPKAISDPNCTNFAHIISAHLDELYAIILASYNARIRAMQAGGKKNQDSSGVERSLKKELAALRAENEELASKNKTLQARLDSSVETNAQLREELSQVNAAARKDVLAVEAEHRQEIKDLTKRLEEAEAETKALLEDLVAVEDEVEGTSDDDIEGALSGVDLPKEGILFLGGHPNMVKKLRQIYPDWTYLDLKDRAQMRVDRIVDLCFIWSKHLSHTAMNMVARNIKGDFPMVYLEATNLSRLEAEMREGYASVMEGAGVAAAG